MHSFNKRTRTKKKKSNGKKSKQLKSIKLVKKKDKKTYNKLADILDPKTTNKFIWLHNRYLGLQNSHKANTLSINSYLKQLNDRYATPVWYPTEETYQHPFKTKLKLPPSYDLFLQFQDPRKKSHLIQVYHNSQTQEFAFYEFTEPMFSKYPNLKIDKNAKRGLTILKWKKDQEINTYMLSQDLRERNIYNNFNQMASLGNYYNKENDLEFIRTNFPKLNTPQGILKIKGCPNYSLNSTAESFNKVYYFQIIDPDTQHVYQVLNNLNYYPA